MVTLLNEIEEDFNFSSNEYSNIVLPVSTQSNAFYLRATPVVRMSFFSCSYTIALIDVKFVWTFCDFSDSLPFSTKLCWYLR